MAANGDLARRVVEAGRSCSLTTAVLEEWSTLGTPKQVEYLAGCLEAEPGQQGGLQARDAAAALRAAGAEDVRRVRLVGGLVARGARGAPTWPRWGSSSAARTSC